MKRRRERENNQQSTPSHRSDDANNRMTGAAVINSPHAFQRIRNLFVEKYLTPETNKWPSHNMKLAWQSAAVSKAALEIIHGDKMCAKDIHTKMWEKYLSWSNVFCEEADAGMKIEPRPDYLAPDYFTTSDAAHKKSFPGGAETGKKLWKKWGSVKSAVINSDNNVVKKTIASMPGGALPSGTDWDLFLTRLVYNLYIVKEKGKTPKEKENDNDEARTDEMGGSAAKETGPSPYTDGPDEVNSDAEGDEAGEKDDEGDNAVCDDVDACVDGEDDHDEPKAPHTFPPSTIFIVMTSGVLSDDCDPLLNHAIDRGEVEDPRRAEVPSRSECRVSALADVSSPSVITARNTTATSLQRLKERASYNEAYKEANKQKNELGIKRLKLSEDELEIKRLEVKARQDEVRARQEEVKARQDKVRAQGLEQYYADLRQDLKDAQDNGNDEEEIHNIREEMIKVRKERRELSMRNN